MGWFLEFSSLMILDDPLPNSAFETRAYRTVSQPPILPLDYPNRHIPQNPEPPILDGTSTDYEGKSSGGILWRTAYT